MIKPIGKIVIIRRSTPREVSDGGIHLVWDSDYREDIGTVLYAGPDAKSVKPGDKVLFSTNGHQLTVIDGEQLVVLKQDSIIGVIMGGSIESGTRKIDRQYAGIE